MPFILRAYFTPCPSADAPPAGPLPGGLVRPVAPASDDDPDVVVLPGRDAERAAALKLLEGYRAQKHRGKRPHEKIDLVVSGPPPAGDAEAWSAARVEEWGAAAAVAVRGLFTDGPARPLFLDSALHVGELAPRLHMPFVPRVTGAGGLIRLSWRQLQADAAERVVDSFVPERSLQFSLIFDRLFVAVGEPFGLVRDPRSGPSSARGLREALEKIKKLRKANEEIFEVTRKLKQEAGEYFAAKTSAEQTAKEANLEAVFYSWWLASSFSMIRSLSQKVPDVGDPTAYFLKCFDIVYQSIDNEVVRRGDPATLAGLAELLKIPGFKRAYPPLKSRVAAAKPPPSRPPGGPARG